jgi:flagellar M-ring protein FliF
MDKPLATILPAAHQAAGTETDRIAPLGRAGAARRWLGPRRLIVLGATALGLFGLLVSLLLRVAEPHDAPLYWDLPLDDTAAIVGRLEALGVPFRRREDGRTILVAADQAPRLRMTLAEEGLPRGRTAATRIFDRQSPLGFPASVKLRRGLEREFARTIASLPHVRAARVHLVLPRQGLLRRQPVPPSASVTLDMNGARRLAPRHVQAVQHLIAIALPGLAPEHVVLIDDRGALLARGGAGALRGLAQR